MHYRTRRLLCRGIFLALGVAPTLVVMASVLVARSSSYQAAQRRSWETRLSEQTGLKVAMDAVRNPSRGIVLLQNLELRDPETDAVVARIRQLEMGHNGRQFIVIASQPELQGRQVWRLWEVLHDRILRGHSASGLNMQWFAGEVTLHHAGGDSASTMTDVRCRLSSSPDGPQADIEFRDVASQESKPTRLRITRQRHETHPITRWELQAQSSALPCGLLAEHVPELSCLGDRATFQGTVEMQCGSSGWQGDLSGQFRNVELDRLVSDRFDHKLSGEATLVFRRARMAEGKLVDAAGDLTCHGGVVSWSLLNQADKALGLVAEDRIRAIDVDKYIRYRELRFGFSLTQAGLSIVGHCEGGDDGVVMADQRGPLLRDRPQEIAQVVALVRTLASESGEQVPATSGAYQLLRMLPIPSAQQHDAVHDSRSLHTPLRME